MSRHDSDVLDTTACESTKAQSLINQVLLGCESLAVDSRTVCDEHIQSEHGEQSKPTDHDRYIFNDDELIELEMLRDQEIDALVSNGLLSEEERWDNERRNSLHFVYPDMRLDLVTGRHYPVMPLTYEVTNISLPRVVADRLFVSLRETCKQCIESNTFEKWTNRGLSAIGCYEFEMTALNIATLTVAYLKQFRMEPTSWKQRTLSNKTDYCLSRERMSLLGEYGFPLPDSNDDDDVDFIFNPDWSKRTRDTTPETKLAFSNVQHLSEIKDSMFGIDASTIQGHGLANSILGKTPEEICAKIPEKFRILHIESVIRSDLTSKFLRFQVNVKIDLEKLPLNILKGCVKHETRQELGKRANEKPTLIDILLTPELSFHCTRADLIPSIVQQGFLKPVRENDIRCGSTYGRGIYSSPDPTFSLMYTEFRETPTTFNEFGGLKLIVCAMITGRCRYMTRGDGWRNQSEPYPGSHCHVANDLLEYVAFDNAQIVPCYIIHLDLGRDAARYITSLSQNPIAYINQYRERQRKKAWADQRLGLVALAPGEKQRQKEALLAKAQKYFPYGYGTSSGTKFQVVDVGEVSEDEEEYGEYQKDRVDGIGITDIWAVDDHTTFALDDDGETSERAEGSEEDPDHGRTKERGDEEIAWEDQTGPEGRTKFDEYYDARIAKLKKIVPAPKRREW